MFFLWLPYDFPMMFLWFSYACQIHEYQIASMDDIAAHFRSGPFRNYRAQSWTPINSEDSDGKIRWDHMPIEVLFDSRRDLGSCIRYSRPSGIVRRSPLRTRRGPGNGMHSTGCCCIARRRPLLSRSVVGDCIHSTVFLGIVRRSPLCIKQGHRHNREVHNTTILEFPSKRVRIYFIVFLFSS